MVYRLRPVSLRRTIAMLTSRIGTAQIASGAASVKVAALLSEAWTAVKPSVSPVTMLPVSPRNTRAGGKLKYRNASSPPTSAATSVASARWPPAGSNRQRTATAVPSTIPTAAAKPSIPSSRLTALTAPSRKKAVKGTAATPNSISYPATPSRRMTVPPTTSSPTARHCPSNFCRPRRPKVSSAKPTAASTPAAARNVSSRPPARVHNAAAPGTAFVTASPASTATATPSPASTASPPPRGTARSCSLRRASGASTAFHRGSSLMSGGSSVNAVTRPTARQIRTNVMPSGEPGGVTRGSSCGRGQRLPGIAASARRGFVKIRGKQDSSCGLPACTPSGAARRRECHSIDDPHPVPRLR